MKVNVIPRAMLIMALATACSDTSKAQKQVEPVDPFPNSATVTASPVVPATITVWDQPFDVDRADIFERLDRELTSITYTHGNTLLTLKRANRLFPEIVPILRKNDVPMDMLYLAITESNLDTRAVSPAKAAGIWQFMPATAKQYGLEVNEFVDERFNLEKATQAACRYFKEAYKKFGDWNTVAASYNAGTGRISSELASQKEDSALDLYLVSETSRYPFRIMAHKLIFENPRAYGFYLTPEQFYQPMEYDEFTVNTPIADLVAWAQNHGISYAQLREANPWIRARRLPNATGKSYTIRVPKKESLNRSTQKVKIFNPAWVSDKK